MPLLHVLTQHQSRRKASRSKDPDLGFFRHHQSKALASHRITVLLRPRNESVLQHLPMHKPISRRGKFIIFILRPVCPSERATKSGPWLDIPLLAFASDGTLPVHIEKIAHTHHAPWLHPSPASRAQSERVQTDTHSILINVSVYPCCYSPLQEDYATIDGHLTGCQTNLTHTQRCGSVSLSRRAEEVFDPLFDGTIHSILNLHALSFNHLQIRAHVPSGEPGLAHQRLRRLLRISWRRETAG